jgi:catechol 2,3-dioxygenase-like lactoylglutathione lyase family enzyme
MHRLLSAGVRSTAGEFVSGKYLREAILPFMQMARSLPIGTDLKIAFTIRLLLGANAFDFVPSAALQLRVMLTRLVSSLSLFATLAVPGFAQRPVRPAITGIAFMRVYTSDPSGAQKFYGDTLGYQRHDVRGDWVYPVNHAQWIEVVPHLGPEQNGRMAAIAFTTRDAAGLEKYLRAKDVAIDEPIHAGEFSVRDPEGNRVIFVQGAAKR